MTEGTRELKELREEGEKVREKEFVLSMFILEADYGERTVIEVSDVKEFIKRLKEELSKVYVDASNGFSPIIDKLAGEELK